MHDMFICKTNQMVLFGDEAKTVMMARASTCNNNKQQEETLNEDGLTQQEEALVKSIQFGQTIIVYCRTTHQEIERGG